MAHLGDVRTPYASAQFIWGWARENIGEVEGELLLTGRDWRTLSARQFYNVTYVLMGKRYGREYVEQRIQELLLDTPEGNEELAEKMEANTEQGNMEVMSLLGGMAQAKPRR